MKSPPRFFVQFQSILDDKWFTIGIYAPADDGYASIQEAVDSAKGKNYSRIRIIEQRIVSQHRTTRARKKICPHERLNEDGICRQCGVDRRGIQ